MTTRTGHPGGPAGSARPRPALAVPVAENGFGTPGGRGIARAADSTLTVRAEEATGPVTRAASGGLYALRDNSVPADSLLLPLRMHSVTQPAPRVGRRPNGQPPGGDALVTAPKADRTGAAVIIRMPDIYPDFPYRWVSWSDWLGRVDLQVRDRLAATAVSNIEGWELWNEPDWTWDTSAAGPFNDGWTRTFRRVRELDPVTPIVGPSTTHYRRDYIRHRWKPAGPGLVRRAGRRRPPGPARPPAGPRAMPVPGPRGPRGPRGRRAWRGSPGWG
ncbi:hypothetical protein SAMN05421773_107278 [Streptomyces aidingensis]|uniref:Glycosyl hydrolases family 39 n=1 Tax=Streptomyces aidingensis TaxID=910347 RepID=A0A1I1N9C6_9ACTN|nr:hypothetical protein SAMN05421773_107278 [Streptomyces aidingensis]